MIGQSLGPYRVRELLGAGGMGEVYLATDSRLGRDVAIKVLPEDVVNDPDLLGRLKREARALAALNHPNIAAIYGVEESQGQFALILELVDGPTLAQRIDEGALPIEQALPLAFQIGLALEAAHEHGIIHRDVKPANVKVRSDGTVKVLDFGIAKMLQPEGDEASDTSTSVQTQATRDGEILGTVTYMAPEQLRAQPVDYRADIWAFGCIVYEMLTGSSPFAAATLSDTIARILDDDPDWEALPRGTPSSVRRMLRRCLSKERAKRLRHIGDALLEITEPEEKREPFSRPPARWGVGALGLVAVAVAFFVGSRLNDNGAPNVVAPEPGLQLMLPTPAPLDVDGIDARLSSLVALAPDASRVVYAARDGETSVLYEHPLDGTEATPLAGTAGAHSPFFSPDGRAIGYTAKQRLATRRLDGGGSRDIGPTGARTAGVWTSSNELITVVDKNLVRYTESGDVQPVATASGGVSGFAWPFLLPGQERLLVATRSAGASLLDDPSQISVVSLADGTSRVLIENGSSPQFVPTNEGGRQGHLLYALDGNVWAAPLDLEDMEILGQAVPVLDDVMMRPNGDAAQYAVAPNGTLVYLSGKQRNELIWVDNEGVVTPASRHQRPFAMPRLSPDGTQVALELHEGAHQIWVLDLARDMLSRMSYTPGVHYYAWSPDSRSMLFTKIRDGVASIAWKRIDDAGEGSVILADPARSLWVVSWSADGRWAGIGELRASTRNVFLLPLEPGEPPRAAGDLVPVAVSEFRERDAMVSPDGSCVAYKSNETGRWEVYLRCLDTDERVQVSSSGAEEPVWSRSGDRLYFRSANRLMAVEVDRSARLQTSLPVEIHQGEFLEFDPANFDVAEDDQRFIRVRSVSAAGQDRLLTIRFGWQRELARLAPPSGREPLRN